MATTFYNPYERDPVNVNASDGDDEQRLISDFVLDLSDLPAASEVRQFVVYGNNGAEFKLHIKDNTTGYYYNFVTNAFQVDNAFLQQVIIGGNYKGSITFPAVTGGDDQYDIFLYAVPTNTRHASYTEARFADGSLDINGSSGSNSLMMQKVIYQYAALTLTMAGYSPGGTVSGTMATDTVSINRGKPTSSTPFSFTTTAAATAAYRVLRQPVSSDVLAFLEPVVGAAPIAIAGENIYLTATPAFTGDDINGAVTSGVVVDTDATDISANINIGDKITTPVTTDTVNGARDTSSVTVTMDAVTATKMAVGDRITSSSVSLANDIFFTKNEITVAAIGSGGTANEFDLSEVAAIADGATLTFSSKVNRSLTTVIAPFPADASAFTISQAIQFRDNAPLTFFQQKNYQWPVNDFAHILREDMIVLQATNVTTGTSISPYQETVTVFPNTNKQKIIVTKSVPATSTLGVKPVITNGLISTQTGAVVFDKQQVLALAGDTLKIGGYGESEILRVFGWEVKFTDLAITLTAPTTTTTEATSAHATIAVADKEGVINNVSRVGGIGINSSLQNPLITSGGGADGAGDWVMDATQTLESGATLTVENTGRIATITGNIEIVKAGNANQTLRFDVNNLLSTTAP